MTTVETRQEFKVQAYKAVFSIILFIAVYFILFLLAIGLLVACGYAAAALIMAKAHFVTLALGIGLLAVGFFAVLFMVKFIFKKSTADYSHLTEIDIETQPELCRVILELVDETGTKFPKKIYLSPEVNASVFYDSSFWSMFFPVRKNLHIGLGLANATTVSEFKGILAHEFGHFSQRSMKIGSYVYNVNKIIHNILYDNEDYENNLRNWSNRSGYFALLIGIAVAFNKGVQWVLRQLYTMVNKNHMGLSRQMEFHADAIAAHIVGSQPMSDAMLRMNLISEAYSRVIDFYNQKVPDSRYTQNIFPQHAFVLGYIAQNNGIEMVNGLPRVTGEFSQRFNKSKLVIKNQWDSHPAEEDRVAAFQKLGISPKNPDLRPANVLFKNTESLQQQMTAKLFSGVEYPQEPTVVTPDAFAAEFMADYSANTFPNLFNSYYSHHNIVPFELESTAAKITLKPDFHSLFDNEKTDMVFHYNAQINDSATLKSIAENSYDLKTFDYDGVKYKVKDAQMVHQNIESEIKNSRHKIEQNDLGVFSYFYLVAQSVGRHQELLKHYQDYFAADTDYDAKMKIYHDTVNDFRFVYDTLPHEQIRSKMNYFKSTEEKFRAALRDMAGGGFYTDGISAKARQEFENYLGDQFAYFSGVAYHEEEIRILEEILDQYANAINRNYFQKKKKLLDFKASLVN